MSLSKQPSTVPSNDENDRGSNDLHRAAGQDGTIVDVRMGHEYQWQSQLP